MDCLVAKKPRLAVSIADKASKLKLLLSSRCVEEKTDPSSDSDLLRLRTILDEAFANPASVTMTIGEEL